MTLIGLHNKFTTVLHKYTTTNNFFYVTIFFGVQILSTCCQAHDSMNHLLTSIIYLALSFSLRVCWSIKIQNPSLILDS